MFIPLLLWIIISLIVIFIELLINFLWLSSSKFVSPNIILNNSQTQTLDSHYFDSIGIIILSALFLGFLIGWLIELKLKFLDKMNKHWQKTQPIFYKYFHPDIRQLIPLGLLSFIFIILAILQILLHNLFLLFFFIGMIIGLAVEPIRNHRNMILMDRPEKPVRALIHKIIPVFPMKISLWIGELYQRVLLPLFFSFLSLLFPIFLDVSSNITPTNSYFLLISLTIGLLLGWYFSKDKILYLEKLDRVLILTYTGKLIFTITLILYAIFSANIFIILFIGVLSGWILSPI